MTHDQAVAMAYRTKPAKRKVPIAFSDGYMTVLINKEKDSNEKP